MLITIDKLIKPKMVIQIDYLLAYLILVRQSKLTLIIDALAINTLISSHCLITNRIIALFFLESER